MKKTTLRLSNRATFYIGLSAITFFFHSNSFSQTTSIQSSSKVQQSIIVPQFANESERQEWILAHPEEVKFLSGYYKDEIANSENDFPQFVNTGNPEKDAISFQERKRAWILAHPEEYKKMIESNSTEFTNK